MGRNGALVHISPRGIENRLNEPIAETEDLRDGGRGGDGEWAHGGNDGRNDAWRRAGVVAPSAEIQQGEAAWSREGANGKSAAIAEARADRQLPSEPATSTISPTRAEAVVAAAAAVDAAAFALQQQQQSARASTPRSRSADAKLLAQKQEEHVLYLQRQQQQQLASLSRLPQQQQLASLSRSTSERSLELTTTNLASARDEQEREGDAGSEMSSATQRIHEAFLLLSAKDSSPDGKDAAAADAHIRESNVDQLKTTAVSVGSDDTIARRGSESVGGSSARDGQHLTFKDFQAQIEKQQLEARVSELEASLKMTSEKVREYEGKADERGERLREAETRISELHSILEELEVGRELDKRHPSLQEPVDIATVLREKEELESEILVARRIATFRAVRIAVLQQQQQQQQQEAEQQARKIETLHEASRSLSAIKERDHERMQASLESAASKISRLQQENRRLQRLLQNRMALDPGDARSDASGNGRFTVAAASSESREPAISLAHHAARDVNSEPPADELKTVVPRGAKPRTNRSRDSSISPRKSRVSLADGQAPSPRAGDLVLVGGGGSGGGVFLLPGNSASTGGSTAEMGAGGGSWQGDVAAAKSTPAAGLDCRQNAGAGTPGSVESMHWSSTSSDEHLHDRISSRRAVSSKRKKQRPRTPDSVSSSSPSPKMASRLSLTSDTLHKSSIR